MASGKQKQQPLDVAEELAQHGPVCSLTVALKCGIHPAEAWRAFMTSEKWERVGQRWFQLKRSEGATASKASAPRI